MTLADPPVVPDPWRSSFEPWPEPPRWQPGRRCLSHGDACEQGCPSCPPDDHPLQERP